MKKKRILSLLLAAVMTATSLPIVATSVSAATDPVTATVGVDLLDGVTPTGTEEIRSGIIDTNRGGYLHVGNRSSGVSGLGLNFDTTFEVGETYFLSFDVRSSVSVRNGLTHSWPVGRLWLRVGGDTAHALRGADNPFKYWELSRIPGTGNAKNNKYDTNAYKTEPTYRSQTDVDNQYIMLAANFTTYPTGANVYAKMQNAGMAADYVAVAAVSSGWTSFEVMLPGVVTEDTNPYVAIFGVVADNETASFDIDNIRLYKRDKSTMDGQENLREQLPITPYLVEYTFDSAPAIATNVDAADDKGNFFVTNGISRPTTLAQLNGATLTYVTADEAYSEIDRSGKNVTGKNNAIVSRPGNETSEVTTPPAVTYTASAILTPGIYELTGEFRDGWHTNGKTSFDNSSMKLTPKINVVGDGDITLAQAQLCTEWTTVSERFVVSAETTLENVTFASNVNETLQFRDVSLVKVGDYVVENTDIESGILAESGVTKPTYTNVSAVHDIYDMDDNGSLAKNGYITVDRRLWTYPKDNWNPSEGYTPVTRLVDLYLDSNVKFEAGYTYFLKFDIRHNVPTNEAQYLQFRIAGNDAGKKTHDMLKGSADWERNIQMELTAEDAGVGKNVSIYIRRHWSERDIPVDIDNITIWREVTGGGDKQFNAATDDTLYFENFNNINGNYLGKSAGKIYNNDGTPLYHNFDENYASVNSSQSSDCSISYGLNQPSGVYTFSADVRVPYFHYVNISQKNATDKIAQDDTAALNAFYATNKHSATVSFILEPVDSNTPAKDPITVTQDLGFLWSNISTSVIVEEGYKLTGVKVTPIFSEKIPAANKALNFKNVSLVRDGGYVVNNDAIESGDYLTNATKNYTEVDTAYDTTDFETDNGVAAKNGYISVGRHPWIYRSNNWVSSNLIVFKQNAAIQYVEGNQYGVTFRARLGAKTNETVKVRASFYGSTAGTTELQLTSDWADYSAVWTAGSGTNNQHINFSINAIGNNVDTPVDIDDLVIWEDSNRNKVYDSGEKIAYSKNYNDPDVQYIGTTTNPDLILTKFTGSSPWPTAANSVGAANINERFYNNFDHYFEDNYAVGDLAYTNITGAVEGTYTFTADIQLPYHYHYDMTQITSLDMAMAQAAYDLNDHNVNVIFTLTDADNGTTDKTVKLTKAANAKWNSIAASVVVDEGCTLTGVKVELESNLIPGTENPVVPTDKQVFNFRNVNLAKSGVVGKDDLEFDDAENFLNAADENYVGSFHTAVEEVIEDDKTNGFITVDRRKWEWSNSGRWYDGAKHDDEPEGYTATLPLINLTTSEEYSSDYTYYFAFDVRYNVPTNTKQKLQLVFTYTQPKADDPEKFEGKSTNVKVNLDIVEDADGWMHVVSDGYTPGATDSGNVTLYVRRYQHEKDVPLDFDNLVVWKEKNDSSKNGTFGAEDASNIIYQSDFNAVDGDYLGSAAGKISNSKATPLYHNFDEEYDRLVPEDNTKVPVLTYTDLNGGSGHGEGVYIFSADLRIPYFKHVNISSKHPSAYVDGTIPLNWANGSDLEPFYALNDHAVTVMFTMEPISADYAETAPVALNADINFLWSTIDTAVVVPEGYKLTKIEIKPTYSSFDNENVVPNEFKAFDFKNVSLSHSDLPVVEAEGEDNYLDGVKPEYENVVPVEVIMANPDGELYVSPRTPETSVNFLVITTGEAVKANREYFVSYDISNESSTRMMLRTLVNVDTVYEDGVVANKYVDDITGSAFESIWFDNNGIAEGGSLWNHYYINGNQSGTFKGHFTPSKDISNLAFTFHRGDGNKRDIQALTIDNFRIWYVEYGKEIDVYNNNFDSESDGNRGISGNSGAGSVYTIEHMLPVTHTLYTPIDPEETMSVTYELGLTVDEAVEGKYSFKTMVKLAESTDMNAKARVIFNYSDGTSDGNYIDLTEDWSYIGKSDWLEKYPDLVSITLEFDSDVPVMLVKPELTIFYKWTYGRPNSGIVMVLLKKLQGKMVDPWKQVGVN